jgi:sugar phosphate isomerase/epimerase
MPDSKMLVYFVNWKLLPEAEIDSVLAQLREWGVRQLVFPPCWGEAESQRPGRLAERAAKIQSLGMCIPAAHGFWGEGWDLSCLDPELRRPMLARHQDFLRSLAPLGVVTYTLHPGITEVQTSPQQWSAIAQSLEELLPTAEETGIILALENGHESLEDLHHLAALTDEYRHPNLGLCFDSGHANSFSPLGALGVAQMLADKWVTCHLHDNYGTEDEHNPPGEGNIAWKELMPILKKCPRLQHLESEAGDWQRKAWEKFRNLWSLE